MNPEHFEILSVGTELLTGRTLNTNAHWMAQQITKLSGSLLRITTVRDSHQEIVSALREAVRRRPGWLLVSGGLGPTYDDMTLEAVGKAFRLELAISNNALNMVRAKYLRLKKAGKIAEVELTPARLKMATLPSGSKAIPNPIGTAPGVLLNISDTCLICLPGVPSEMEEIFRKSVIPLVKGKLAGVAKAELEFRVRGLMESVLAPILEKVIQQYPRVYVKSHPRGIEDGVSNLDIHIVAWEANVALAKKKAYRVKNTLWRLMGLKGGKGV